MRKYALLGLLSVALLALLLRLLPLLRYDFWGVDTGEYFGIAAALKNQHHLDPVGYQGFGFTYPYFPGLYLAVASTTMVTGIPLYWSFSLFGPIMGALTAVFVFLIANYLFQRPGAALFSALFVGVIVVHVYQTSRTMPATLGHLLLVICLFLFLRLAEDPRFLALLVPVTAALVLTHHLSVYFLMVACFGAVTVRELLGLQRKGRYLANYCYLAFLCIISSVYWLGAVAPFRDEVVGPALASKGIPVIVLPVGLLACVGILYAFGRFRTKCKWRYRSTFRSFRWSVGTVGIGVAISAGILVWIAFFGISNVPVQDKGWMILFIPAAALISFIGAGLCYSDFDRSGILVYGILAGLGMSFIAAVALDSHEIFPDRHAEIIMVVLALLLGLGIYMLFSLRSESSSLHSRVQALVAVLALFGACAFTAYPPTTVLGGGEQGTLPDDTEGILWARGGILLENDNCIATENRLSAGLWGIAGLPATWYSAHETFYATDFSGARDEMQKCETPSGTKRIDYIMLDRAMNNGAVLTPWEPHEPIDGAAWEKFDNAPYVKIFDNGYCVIYAVNWAEA